MNIILVEMFINKGIMIKTMNLGIILVKIRYKLYLMVRQLCKIKNRKSVYPLYCL